MDEPAPLARLTEASLALDPIVRLSEASLNVWYVLGDIGVVDDALAHHWATTPVHEAAHAVAHVLAGSEAGTVHYFPFGPVNGALGYYRSKGERKGRRVLVSDLVDQHGAVAVARSVVGMYAGTVAELRYDPRRAASGFFGDRQSAASVCVNFEDMGLADRDDLQAWAWSEACRMFQSQDVWAATIELADRLRASKSFRARVSGPVIQKSVARHCPNGWAWRAAPIKADPR